MISIEKARNQMSKEINIVEFVKNRRYVKMALRYLLNRDKQRKIKDKSRYIIIKEIDEKEE